MKNVTFRIGGVHPHDSKLSRDCAIETLPLPQTVYVSMAQHLGAPATPVVAVGDKVKVGQVLAEPAGFISAFVHSPASGTVKSIAPRADIAGKMVTHIEIAVEGDEWAEGIDLSDTLVTEIPADRAAVLERIKKNGVVGLGGATFPTHVKLNPAPGSKAECLIINGAECEPYLTSDYRIMLERTKEIIVGAAIMQSVLGGCPCVLAIEENKPEAIQAMQKALDWIKGICAVPEVGAVYHGKVVSILEFGAFVEILPGKEGLLHVSEIAWTKTEKVEDVLSVGQEVDVKLLEVDAKTGKLRLSMRALTEKPEGYREPERRPRPERSDRRDDRRSDRGDRRSDRGDRRSDRGDDRGERSDRNERGERRFDRGADRNDRRSGRNFGPRNEAPAPAADDFKEPVEEIF